MSASTVPMAHWPVVGLALWWEMSSGGKCPLTGNVLWWVFPCLCTFRPSGRKRLLVGKVLWWELSSGGACPTCFPTLLYLPNCPLQKLHTVLFPPLLFHKFFLSDHSCFTRVCFTQFSSHHSCSTSFFFPTSPAPQGLPSHSSLPATPAPQGFASHSSHPTTPASQGLASHISLPTTPASQGFCFPTTLASQGFAFPPLLLHKGLFTHHSCSTRVCFTQFSTRAVPQGSASRLSTTPASQKLVSQGFPCTLASQGLITQGPLLLHWSLLH